MSLTALLAQPESSTVPSSGQPHAAEPAAPAQPVFAGQLTGALPRSSEKQPSASCAQVKTAGSFGALQKGPAAVQVAGVGALHSHLALGRVPAHFAFAPQVLVVVANTQPNISTAQVFTSWPRQ